MPGIPTFGHHKENTWMYHTISKMAHLCPSPKTLENMFSHLNIHQLMDATDTFFANRKALGGDTCAQVFYGIQSPMINVYPMKTESYGPVAYDDFLREDGCPTLLT